MQFIGLQHYMRIFSFSLKMALRSMRFRSFRTLLTVLGITIGIMTFTALMSIGVGMQSQISSLIMQMMGGGMMVASAVSSSSPSVPMDVGTNLQQIEGVNETVGAIEEFVEVGGQYLDLAGVEPDKLETVFGVTISRGHNLRWALDHGINNPLIIDEGAAKNLGYDINETLIVSSMMSGTFMEFQIVGIASALQIDISFVMAGLAYTDLAVMQDLMETKNVEYFMVSVKEGYDMGTIAEPIREAYPEAEVTTSEDILAMADQILNIVFAVLMAIGSISLLVGALMITNTTMMSVIERTREIGIIKSIGGKRSHVLTIFMTESVLIATIGGIMGCIFSVIVVTSLTGLVKAMYGFPLAYSLEAWIFMVGIGLAAGIGGLAGAFPSWRAASVKPVEALRYQ